MNSHLKSVANQNLERLKANPYPGRGIIPGRSITGEMVQVYFVMGRSENSQNRVMSVDGEDRVFTEAADPTKVKDPSLIIYNAMDSNGHFHAVSNGNQTDDIINSLAHNGHEINLGEMLLHREYEPDEPNFTPRISGLSNNGKPSFQLSMLRKSAFGDDCERFLWQYENIAPGFGYCIHTYIGDGKVLPAFCGEPFLVPLDQETHTKIEDTYWNVLNPDYRVSLAVKIIFPNENSVVSVENRFQKVVRTGTTKK